MGTVEEAARLRQVLVEGHDALSVALESLSRTIGAIEEMWPALPPTGRIGRPLDQRDRHAYHDDGDPAGRDLVALHRWYDELQGRDDDDDEDDDRDDDLTDEPSPLGAVASAMSHTIEALRLLQPPAPPPVSFPLSTVELRRLLAQFGDGADRERYGAWGAAT